MRHLALEHHRAGEFFVLRFPLLPFADFAELDHGDLRRNIRALCEDERLREALFFASPVVDAQVQRWDELPEARARQLTATIYKYLSRMSTRCAPFGAFAGYSIGRVGPQTDFRGFGETACERVVELSAVWLRQVIDSLQSSSRVRENSRWHRNPTARHAGDAIRYIQRYVDGQSYSYGLSEVDASPLILYALADATGKTIDEIAAAITAHDGSVAEDEARQFVDDLVDAQLLVSDLELPVTSDDAAIAAVQLLRAHGVDDLGAAIERSAAALRRISTEPLGVSPDVYYQIASELQSVSGVDASRAFNAKLTRSVTPEIAPQIIAEADRAVALLHRVAKREKPLDSFIEAFDLRFGTREVPLLEALDPETGIPFPPVSSDSAPLIGGLPFPEGDERPEGWSNRDDVLLNLLTDCLRAGKNEISLTNDDILRIAGDSNPLPLPDAFAVRCSIAARNEDEIRRGEFRLIVEDVSGPSGARLLTRFCATDPVLLDHVHRHIAGEERCRPDAVYAEVLHVPSCDYAVAVTRPSVREYEIPLLDASSRPPEQQIPLDDLIVSVDSGRVLLRSRRLGREVIPRLTSAINLHHPTSFALHRFFGSLARQGQTAYLYWQWGRLSAADYLPRVTSGRIVLMPQTWRVPVEEIDELSGGDERIIAWCRRRNVPRFVRVNRELVLDLDSTTGRATLADLARNGVVLTELLPEPDHLWVGGARPFVHEILIPYVSTAEPVRERPSRPSGSTGERLFVPGSEWLYARLYAGHSSVDRILIGPIHQLTEELSEEGIVDRWFFLRYGDSDSDWHLRVRFHGVADAMSAVVLPRLREAVQPYIDAGVISRFELGTYDREVERYGGWPGIELAEAVFHADSEFVVRALSMINDDDERWRCAVRGVDALLDDLGCDAGSKRTIVQSLRQQHARHLKTDKQFARQLGARFRSLRRDVESALDGTSFDGALAALFQDRSERLAPLVRELHAREADGRLNAPVAAIAGSFIHMFLNRLIRASHRQHELVICDFLDRAYESRIMRSRGVLHR